MKKKTLTKIERASKKLTEAAELISDAYDEVFYEETRMLTRNMTVQDTIKELCGRTRELKFDYNSTLNAIREA